VLRLSVVRRPFLLNRACLIERGAGKPIFEGFELSVQRLNFFVLSKNHVAELAHGLLQKGNLGLNPLQRVFELAQRFAP